MGIAGPRAGTASDNRKIVDVPVHTDIRRNRVVPAYRCAEGLPVGSGVEPQQEIVPIRRRTRIGIKDQPRVAARVNGHIKVGHTEDVGSRNSGLATADVHGAPGEAVMLGGNPRAGSRAREIPRIRPRAAGVARQGDVVVVDSAIWVPIRQRVGSVIEAPVCHGAQSGPLARPGQSRAHVEDDGAVADVRVEPPALAGEGRHRTGEGVNLRTQIAVPIVIARILLYLDVVVCSPVEEGRVDVHERIR